jgi:muconolactone delta-isomerase
MNMIQAIFTIHTDQLPANFPEIIQHEQEAVAAWKKEGIIEHLFLRPTKNGAVIIFNSDDEAHVQGLMETLPLYPFVKSIEYLPLIKQF